MPARCCTAPTTPEFTGRICPAPCEAACVVNVNGDAVGIKSIYTSSPAGVWIGKKDFETVGAGPAGLLRPSSWRVPVTT